jgi:group I intron endonuclease
MNIGIYKLWFSNSHKVYIGSSINLKKRIYEHKRVLILGQHYNRYLQRAYNKYGISNFRHEVIEICSKETLREREQFWINKLKTSDNEYGYNLVPDAINTGTSGYKLSKSQRKIRLEILENKVWNKKRKTFKFISPKGEIIEIFGLRQFCLKNNLPYRTLCNVHNGIGVSCKGWRKYQENGIIRHHKGKNHVLTNGKGDIFINNLKNYCKNNNLSYEGIRKGCISNGWRIKNYRT